MFEEDLAERVDDLFCEIVGGIGTNRDMDTISMLLTGWIIFVFLAVALVKYLYIRFVKKSHYEAEVQEQSVVSASATEVKANATTDDAIASEPSQPTANGAPRGVVKSSKVVETLTGPKVIQSNRPHRPLRRRRISKDSISIETSIDTSSFLPEGSFSSSPCTGPDEDIVEYINKCHGWLFGDQRTRPLEDVKEAFMDAMNRSLRDGDKKNELAISVVNVSIDDNMQFSNIFAECIKPNTVKVTADCDVQMKGEITVSSKDLGIKRCDFFVDRLNGRLSSLIESKNKIAVIKLDGWPEICMAISTNSPSKGKSTLDPKLTEAIADRITATLRNTVVEVELDRLQDFPKAPEFSPIQVEDNTKKYLLVKVVRGTDLGVLKGCSEPFVVVELDDPAQKFQTTVQEKQSPIWNENFVFNVIPNVGEMLFEVHDKDGDKFLGCNILSIDDIGTEKTRVLPLKSRRMEKSETFTGAIEVQFTFLDEKEFKSREITEKASIKKGDESGGAGLPGQYGDDRGRRKTRRGDIFTSLRRRLSKTRSHSVVTTEARSEDGEEGKDTVSDKDDIFKRSVSADRHSLLSQQGRLMLGSGLGSARSSVSELSAISGHSTTTYVHENSTLVIECMENRIRKYYLVPPHLAETGKWKKRGKKLHIYNDHTFVAKHISSGKICEICTVRLPFALGKQGYQCRDCKMICHKECHVRAPSYCPKTSVYDIELEYLQEGH
ncbi:unnamed protein product [Orchesella dallaii]|uniref:Protein kinase C-like 3 n=1 Tax=Orchesella dallaii TaxID=48710 RepID=A0ABP1QEE5_9HEXA